MAYRDKYICVLLLLSLSIIFNLYQGVIIINAFKNYNTSLQYTSSVIKSSIEIFNAQQRSMENVKDELKRILVREQKIIDFFMPTRKGDVPLKKPKTKKKFSKQPPVKGQDGKIVKPGTWETIKPDGDTVKTFKVPRNGEN